MQNGYGDSSDIAVRWTSCSFFLPEAGTGVFGTLSFGYCVGYSSPASYDLKSASNPAIRLDNSQESCFSVSSAVELYFQF